MSALTEYTAYLERNELGAALAAWYDAVEAEADARSLDDAFWAVRETRLALLEHTSQWWFAIGFAIELLPVTFSLLFQDLDRAVKRAESETWNAWADSGERADGLQYMRAYLAYREETLRWVAVTRAWIDEYRCDDRGA
jgi:hypothetical protein